MRLALELSSTRAVVTGPVRVPGQQIHQQVGVVHTGLAFLWPGVAHREQQLCGEAGEPRGRRERGGVGTMRGEVQMEWRGRYAEEETEKRGRNRDGEEG